MHPNPMNHAGPSRPEHTPVLHIDKPKEPMVQLAVALYDSAPAETRSRALTHLVTQVYAAAPVAVRSRLLEQLIRPLGLLALVSVAGGMFARIRLRDGWQELPVRLEDVQRVRPADLNALVEQVQQVGLEALDGLAQVVASTPLMTASAAVAVLLAVLMRRRTSDADRQ